MTCTCDDRITFALGAIACPTCEEKIAIDELKRELYTKVDCIVDQAIDQTRVFCGQEPHGK